jgi:hypothetical protein
VNVIRMRVSSRWILLASGVLLLTTAGCTSKSSRPSQESETKQSAVANSNSSDQHFDGGTYCVQTFMQGPPPQQPLHFSNKITESNQSLKSKDFEADLAGDTLEIVHHDRWLATDDDRKFFQESSKTDDPKIIVRAINGGVADETVTNHFTRSDQAGWSSGVTAIAQGGTPWGLFIYKPPVSRVGTENIIATRRSSMPWIQPMGVKLKNPPVCCAS